jgi:hypothetical protein
MMVCSGHLIALRSVSDAHWMHVRICVTSDTDLSCTKGGLRELRDVDLDWYWIYVPKITITQIMITGNSLAVAAPWISFL